MADTPSHQDIIDRIHEHDVRLARVEERQSAVIDEVSHQSSRIDHLTLKVDRIAELVTDMTARQRVLLWIAATGIPVLIGLGLWDRV